MSKTDRIFYHERRKSFQKAIDINLKTNLKDEQINDKLLNYKCQNYDQLINPEKPKSKPRKKLSIFSFSKYRKSKTLLDDIGEANEDLNKTETKFSNIELFSNSSFQETLADTSFDSQKSSRLESSSNCFKMLLNEDYTTYIEILKKIYPSFEFNHYNKIKDEYYEYFKKYGDNDINNRNSKYNTNANKNVNEAYKQSNLLDILGVQKNIEVSPTKFRIKDDFLSRTNITELNMIKNDLSFKTGIIDKELESILQAQASKFYNYIEANDNFSKLMTYYADDIKSKIETQKIIKKNYMNNSMKLILKERKKKVSEKILCASYAINELKKYIDILRNLIATDKKDENIIKEISKYTNLGKDKIKFIRKFFGNKNCKFLNSAENIINIYENKGELNLVEQFTLNVKKLIEICLIYNKKNKIDEDVGKTKDNIKANYKLNIEENFTNNEIIIGNKDFELIDNDKNIYIKYMFIYNNLKNNNILNLLISILDMFEIIIRDNMDITLIISIFQEIFKKIINYNLKEIEDQTTNKLILIKIISNCYSIIISNYNYIIYLIQINFGMNSKSFIDITNLMKAEIKKRVLDLIKSYLHGIIYEDWKYFIDGYIKAKNDSEIYFKLNKLNWDEITYELYKKFIISFNESATKELMNEYNKNNNMNLSWDQLSNIDNKYQKMFEKLYVETNIDKITLKQIEINQKINKSENDNILSLYNSDNNNFIYFINEINGNDCGHRISNFSCLYIKYVYKFLYVYIVTKDSSLKKMLVDWLYKVTKDLLLYSEDIIVNNPTGLINNIKKVTEKEISLYFSDLLVIENCLKNFLSIYPDQDISEILYELKNNCIDNIVDSLQKISEDIIQEFKNISLDSYPIHNNKEINNYAKFFNKFKKVYDDLGNAFTSLNIKEMYNNALEYLLNNLNQIIMEKGLINNVKSYNQFKNDIYFIKKVISLLDMVEIDKFNEILDKFMTIVYKEKSI